jgi:2'-deoxynucleoside 5'-phosphate N-hydrolase
MAPAVYFAASITGGRGDAPLYGTILGHLRTLGCEVFAEHVADPLLTAGGETVPLDEIFRRDVGWIAEVARRGGVLVAEVSLPSHGVGYEIAMARYRFGMPVICLWRPAYTARCSAMISGDPEIRLIEYEEGAVWEMLGRLAEELARGSGRQ